MGDLPRRKNTNIFQGGSGLIAMDNLPRRKKQRFFKVA